MTSAWTYTKAIPYSVGIVTFALLEIGVFVAVFMRSGGGTNDMGEVAAIVMCLITSPLCLIGAVIAGKLSKTKISN